MGRAPCCEKVGLNRGPWTREEDLLLTQYINEHGEGAWRTLPKAAGLRRCGKSCRLRWINYLRPDIKHGNISEEEDQMIIKLHSLLGNRLYVFVPGAFADSEYAADHDLIISLLKNAVILEQIVVANCRAAAGKNRQRNQKPLEHASEEKASEHGHRSAIALPDRAEWSRQQQQLRNQLLKSEGAVLPRHAGVSNARIQIAQNAAGSPDRSVGLQRVQKYSKSDKSASKDEDLEQLCSCESHGFSTEEHAEDLTAVSDAADSSPRDLAPSFSCELCPVTVYWDGKQDASTSSLLLNIMHSDVSWDVEILHPIDNLDQPNPASADLWGCN